MASISSPGLGSGLDVNNIVQQLVEVEARPLLSLANTEAQHQAKLSAFGVVKSAFSDFQSRLTGLKNENNFGSVSASQDDPSVFTTTVTDDASEGSFTVDVKALAKAHKISSSHAFNDVADAVGTGTLSFTFGRYDSETNQFENDPSQTTRTVLIDESNQSLAGIRDAVNAADIGVSASILNDGTGHRLVFTSDNSGADSSMRILASEDGGSATNTDVSGLSQLAYDPTAAVDNGKNMVENAAAQDSHTVIDGFNIYGDTNTVSDVIEGVTLTLKKPGDAEQTVQVSKENTNGTNNVSSFVDAFNDLSSTVSSLSSLNEANSEKGLLLGDATIRNIQSRLRQLISSVASETNTNIRSLADIGISTNRDGSLGLDSAVLKGALENYPDQVARLFATGSSIDDPLIEIESTGSFDASRRLSVEVTQLATSGELTGDQPAALDISGAQSNFSFVIDGISTGNFNIVAKTYDSLADITQELQTQINNTQAMIDANKSVSVTADDNGNIVITASSFGRASSVTVNQTAGSDALGLTNGMSVSGADVAGYIDGVAATGVGQTLDAGNGVSLKVKGGTTGSREPVLQYRGLAAQFDEFVSELLSSSGIIESREEGLNRSIDDIEQQRQVIEDRLVTFEQNIRARFTTLDTLVAQLNTTSNFLAGQLDIITGIVKGKR